MLGRWEEGLGDGGWEDGDDVYLYMCDFSPVDVILFTYRYLWTQAMSTHVIAFGLGCELTVTVPNPDDVSVAYQAQNKVQKQA